MMAKCYPQPSCIYSFRGFMAPVHCILVDDNILFSGTQEGKVHLWSLDSYRELLSVSASCEPIISIHKTDSKILVQDKEMTISMWTYEPVGVMKKVCCLKRGEPKLSFCKCLVFESDLEIHFNKLGNVINQNKLESPFSALCLENVSKFYVTVPYDSKEITTFSVESRKKVTTIDVTKDSCDKFSDVVMCMKLLEINSNQFLIICTEEGNLSLYDMKLKHKVCQVKLKCDEKLKKHKLKLNSEQENISSSLDSNLDASVVDTPMAIDFDVRTMRGIVGTNSSNLYCFKLYFEANQNLNQCQTVESHSHSNVKASLKIKMVIELKQSGVSCIAIKPDGKLFVLSFWDGNGIFIFNWRNMKCVSYIDYVYKTIHDVSFYNNNTLAVACDGGKVSLWRFSA